VKDTGIIVFGMVIIPLAYLIGFAFKDYDNAFRNSGLLLYTLGFMLADSIMAITRADFFDVTPNESPVKYIAMVDPFIFYYWCQGFPSKNDMSNKGDELKMPLQLGFCFVQIVLGVTFFVLCLYLDQRNFRKIQGFDQFYRDED